MNNAQLLEKVNGALKAITTNDLGSSRLSREKMEQFLRVLADSTPILDGARQIDMGSHTHDIDRVGFGGRILRSASEGEAPSSREQPNFNTNTLESQEVIAEAGITDSTMEDNIETEAFEDTLLDLIANQVGYDLEELFLNGDRDSDDDFLAVTDGWIEKAGNGISGDDFNTSQVESMFDNMLRAVDKRYIRNRSEWTLYVHWDIEDAYRNLLRDRGTGLGDTAQTDAIQLAYKGIQVQDVSNMPTGTAMLVPQNNLVYGLYRDIRIEPERSARRRLTNFVTSLRVDCHFEDENAVVIGEGFNDDNDDNGGDDGDGGGDD